MYKTKIISTNKEDLEIEISELLEKVWKIEGVAGPGGRGWPNCYALLTKKIRNARRRKKV